MSTARRSSPVIALRAAVCSGDGDAASCSRDLADGFVCVRARRRLCRWVRRAAGRGVRSLLLSPDSQRRHPSRLQGQDTPVADHRLRDLECLFGGTSPRRPAPARLSEVLRVDTAWCSISRASKRSSIRRSGLRRSGRRGAEAPPTTRTRAHSRLAPHTQQIASGGEGLRAPVLQREVAQLAAPGSRPVRARKRSAARATHASGRRTPHAAPEEPRPARNTCRLVRRLLDLITVLRELVCERSTVVSAKLTSRTEDRTRADRDEAVVLTTRGGDHDMTVQLWIRSLPARYPRAVVC